MFILCVLCKNMIDHSKDYNNNDKMVFSEKERKSERARDRKFPINSTSLTS